MGYFFKAFVQAVLLFGAETWVLSPRVEQSLRRFWLRVVQRITGRQPRRRQEGGWEYLLLTAVMGEEVFEDILVYITRRQNTVAQYIATRLIMNFCERCVWRLGE